MIPEEAVDSKARKRVLEFEKRLARLSLRCIPALAVLGWLLGSRYLHVLLFLRTDPGSGTPWRGLVVALMMVCGPVAWAASTRWLQQRDRPAESIWCAVLVVLSVVILSIGLDSAQCRFTLEEATKARAPQLHFVRNVVFKQQALAGEQTPPDSARYRVALVGSSQVGLGIELDRVKEQLNCDGMVSVCMPGMVPMQYLALSDHLVRQHPTHVICWLSEFDFFRESELPVVRLRWCSTAANVWRLVDTLSPQQLWHHRSAIADLSLASVMSLWRWRSLSQLIAFRYWWPWTQTDAPSADADEVRIGGRLVEKFQGVQNAKRNVQPTSLVESHFESFLAFAQTLTDARIQLIVMEGESHPQTMAAYPAAYRRLTRTRLRGYADELGFLFIPADSRPSFGAADWRDAVHLNQSGRKRLTDFVIERLSKLEPDWND